MAKSDALQLGPPTENAIQLSTLASLPRLLIDRHRCVRCVGVSGLRVDSSRHVDEIASCPRLALRQPSKSLFPALVEGDPSVRKPRRLPRQLDDRLSHLAAIGERHQKKAFIAFLHNLDLGRGLRHGNETQLAMSGSSCELA
jgi:hypothetical protein